MTPEQFAYWLQGFAEIHDSAPTTQEWKVIKDHLATVFKKITPYYPNPLITTPTLPSPAPFTWPTYVKPEITCSVSSNTWTMPGSGYDYSDISYKPITDGDYNERFKF
jgi:hypothetical protein